MIEHDCPFSCPHCEDAMSARVDATGGKHQSFIQDCETCCRPIQIIVEFEGDEVSRFLAEASE